MATTEYGVNHPLAVKRWEKGLMKEALKKTSFMQFMGRNKNSLCTVKNELTKSKGDRIRFGIRYQLEGEGRIGDDTLEGHEEALVTFTDNVFINQLRHAVRSEGKMSEQRVPFEVREEARDGLSDWYADRMDSAFFNQIAGMSSVTDTKLTGMQAAPAPDASHHLYGGTGPTSEATLASTSTFSLTDIDNMVELAKTAKVPIRPINMGRGDKYYVLFLHPYQITDMRINTNAGQWNDIQKAAMQGGQITKNPIFTGAHGMYNNTIIHENTRVPSAVANTRRAVFAGAQAACWAFGGDSSGNKNYFKWREELFDYGNQLGVAAASIWGLKKTQFNGSDYGTIVLSTWATAHS